MLKPTKHHKCWRKRPLRTNANSWKCTRRVPWLSAILLRQGQAGEFAKIQLPYTCASLAAARDRSRSGRSVLTPPIYTLTKQCGAPALRKIMPSCRAYYRRKRVNRETVSWYLGTDAAFWFSGQRLPSAPPKESSEEFFHRACGANLAPRRSASAPRNFHARAKRMLSLSVFLVIERTIVLLW